MHSTTGLRLLIAIAASLSPLATARQPVADVPPLVEVDDAASEALPRHCGANSVFVAAAVLGSHVPLSRCIEAVPPRSVGNSMSELKAGLERLGFGTRAHPVASGQLGSLRGTFVAWIPQGVEVRTLSGERLTAGHFVVLHRDRDGRWLYLDYPSTALVIEPETWLASILSEHRLADLPLLAVSGSAKPEFKRPAAMEANRSTEVQTGSWRSAEDASGVHGPSVATPADTEGLMRPDEGIPETEIVINAVGVPLLRTTLDFGSRVSGELLTGYVHIWNVLDVTVRLSDLSTTCGCTAGGFDRDVLEPGEAATIEVTLNLAGRTGDVRQSLSLMASAGDDAIPLFVECVAKASQQWSIEPRVVAFRKTPVSGGVVQQLVHVTAAFPGVAGRLYRAEGDNPRISATILANRSAPAEGRYEVMLQLDPTGARSGVFAGQAYLFTETSDMPHVMIPVTARFMEVVEVVPSSVLLSTQAPLVASVTCVHRDGLPLRLLSCRSLKHLLDVEAEVEHDAEGSPELRVSLLVKPRNTGLITDLVELVLAASDGIEHVVRVTVTASDL